MKFRFLHWLDLRKDIDHIRLSFKNLQQYVVSSILHSLLFRYFCIWIEDSSEVYIRHATHDFAKGGGAELKANFKVPITQLVTYAFE